MFARTQRTSFIGVNTKTWRIGCSSVESASRRLRQRLRILTNTVELGRVRRNRHTLKTENVFIFYKCRRDSSIKVEEFEKSTIRNMLIGSIKNYIKIGLMSKSYGRKTNVNWLVMIEGLADKIKNSPIWKKAEQTTGPLQLLRPFTAFLVPAGLLSWAVLNQNIYRAKQLFVGVF